MRTCTISDTADVFQEWGDVISGEYVQTTREVDGHPAYYSQARNCLIKVAIVQNLVRNLVLNLSLKERRKRKTDKEHLFCMTQIAFWYRQHEG